MTDLQDLLKAPENGWRPGPCSADHEIHIFDLLYVDGRSVAAVEAFYSDGPIYANAIAPDGKWYRSGAMLDDLHAAKTWCEQVARGQIPEGYRSMDDPRP